jgi:hypothetical protein
MLQYVTVKGLGMIRTIFAWIPIVLATSCAVTSTPQTAAKAGCDVVAARSAIEAEIQKGIKATMDEDIDAFMDGVPDDFKIVEDDGSITDKAKLRMLTLQRWAIIDKTLALEITIDSVELAPSCLEARLRTSQRWERVMRRRDGVGTDVILTTQKHIESWRAVSGRWYNYDITELGGEIFVNGEPYKP